MKGIKPLVLALALVMVLLVPSLAPAAGKKAQDPEAVFMAMDTDKDGKISKAEFLAFYKNKVRAEKMFVVYDQNGDGYIVKEEYVATAQKLKDAKKAKMAEKGPKDKFAMMDKDKDGKISKEEFVAFYKDKAYAERRFKVLDKNGDGYLVKEEFTVTVKKLPKN